MSATLASIGRRLDRIETARRPPKGLFYVAWGRTPTEIEAALAQARRAGTIADGDPMVRCPWPAGAVPPASRWVQDEMYSIDRPEFDALMDEVDRLAADWRAVLRAEISERGDPRSTPEAIEAAVPPDDGRARKLHDAALFAGVLAVPLDGTRPTLTDDRAWRTLRYIETLGVRDRIRGRSRIAVETGVSADRATRHRGTAMRLAALAARLDRIERAYAARDPARTPRAAVLYLAPGEDAAPHLAALFDRGEHRRGWPVLAIRADWPAVRAMGDATP